MKVLCKIGLHTSKIHHRSWKYWDVVDKIVLVKHVVSCVYCDKEWVYV